MGGGLVPVQQPGLGQYEGPQAQADDPRTFGVCLAQGFEQGLGWPLLGVAPGRHDDHVRLFQHFEPVVHLDIETCGGTEGAVLESADLEGKARHVDAFALLGEHQRRHGQMERADAIEGDHGDMDRGHRSVLD